MRFFSVLITLVLLAPLGHAAGDNLLDRLFSPQPPIRNHAQQELETMESDAKRSLVSPWEDQAKSSDLNAARHAMAGLALLAPQATDIAPFMTDQLKNQDGMIRASALTYFANGGRTLAQSVLPQITSALKDPSPEVRARACDAAGMAGPAAQEDGPLLIQLIMNDPDAGVQSHASNALQFLGPPGKNPAIEQLGQQLQAPDRAVRLQAARSLMKIGLGAQQVAPALIATLKDEDVEVRRYAAFALAAMQAAPPETLPILIGALGSKDLSAMAGVALYQIGPPAIAVLQQAMASESPKVRREAILVLVRMGPQARASESLLIHSMKDPDPGVRQAAAQALVAIGVSTSSIKAQDQAEQAPETGSAAAH